MRLFVLVTQVLLVVACLVVGCDGGGGDGDADSDVDGDADGDADGAASGTIGPDGGSVTNGEASISVPAGALAEDVEIVVGIATAPTPLPDTVELVDEIYSFTPHGQQFASPVAIELPYSGDTAGMAVLVLDDPDDTGWEQVPDVVLEGGVASFSIEHLCYFAVVRSAVSVTEAVVTEIVIPDGVPMDVLVNGDNDLVVFDANIDNPYGIPHLRFVEVTGEGDTFSFALSPDELDLNWNTGLRQGWLAYDGYHDLVYALADDDATTDAGFGWDRWQVYVVSGHSRAGWFEFNPDGGVPLTAPEDFNVEVAGFAIKEARSEGDNPTRLFVHDIVGGNIDVFDLDETGTMFASRERFSYRDRLEESCEWPPAPPPWDCHWLGTIGNTLAVDWQLESESPPGLPDRDLLYVTDHNYSATEVRVLSIAQTGPVDLQSLPDVDIAGAHGIIENGIEGLTMAGPSDRLYVATGIQSFGDGFLAVVDTATQNPDVIILPYSDRAGVLVDPSDSDRIFVAAADSFTENPPLLVHVLESGSLVSTYQVLATYDGSNVDSMAYDADHGLLYIVVDNRILAAQIG